MGEKAAIPPDWDHVPVVNLAEAQGERQAWGRPSWVVYLWGLAELIFVTNPLQISSKLRVAVLRAFGARIGNGVIFRPRTRVRFPWKLSIGDRSWIGEGAWIHNQDEVRIGSDVVLSQEVFLTTGSHALKTDMSLITRPVVIDDGAWITTRSMVLGGCRIGRSAVVAPNVVIGPNAVIGPGQIVKTAEWVAAGHRFRGLARQEER